MGLGALTPRAAKTIRRLSVGTAGAIAIAALVLSYSGLHALAIGAGVSRGLAVLLPVIIDGMAVTGMLGVVYSTLAGISTWYPWSLVLVGVGVSVWGNWVAAPADLVAKGVHASSPIILALVLEELLRVTRHRVRMQYQAAAHPQLAAPRKAPTPVAPAAAVPTPVPVAAPWADQPSVAFTPVATSAERPAPVAVGEGRTARERIRDLLAAEPDLSPAEVYNRLKTDPSSTRKIMRQLAEEAARAAAEAVDADR